MHVLTLWCSVLSPKYQSQTVKTVLTVARITVWWLTTRVCLLLQEAGLMPVCEDEASESNVIDFWRSLCFKLLVPGCQGLQATMFQQMTTNNSGYCWFLLCLYDTEVSRLLWSCWCGYLQANLRFCHLPELPVWKHLTQTLLWHVGVCWSVMSHSLCNLVPDCIDWQCTHVAPTVKIWRGWDSR